MREPGEIDKADCLDATVRLAWETARGRGTSRKARCSRARALGGSFSSTAVTSLSLHHGPNLGAEGVESEGFREHVKVGKFADAPNQPQAAVLLNVGERSVRFAREVIAESAPELIQAVDRGEVSVSAISLCSAVISPTRRLARKTPRREGPRRGARSALVGVRSKRANRLKKAPPGLSCPWRPYPGGSWGSTRLASYAALIATSRSRRSAVSQSSAKLR